VSASAAGFVLDEACGIDEVFAATRGPLSSAP